MFKFLRRNVDGKHDAFSEISPPFSNYSSVAWTGPGTKLVSPNYPWRGQIKRTSFHLLYLNETTSPPVFTGQRLDITGNKEGS